jgi:hypothetical protein
MADEVDQMNPVELRNLLLEIKAGYEVWAHREPLDRSTCIPVVKVLKKIKAVWGQRLSPGRQETLAQYENELKEQFRKCWKCRPVRITTVCSSTEAAA